MTRQQSGRIELWTFRSHALWRVAVVAPAELCQELPSTQYYVPVFRCRNRRDRVLACHTCSRGLRPRSTGDRELTQAGTKRLDGCANESGACTVDQTFSPADRPRLKCSFQKLLSVVIAVGLAHWRAVLTSALRRSVAEHVREASGMRRRAIVKTLFPLAEPCVVPDPTEASLLRPQRTGNRRTRATCAGTCGCRC